MDEELVPYDLTAEPKAYVFLQPGWAERLAELAPRNDQIVAYDAAPPGQPQEPPGQPQEPPWVPMRDNIPRAPMCRCRVLPIEDDEDDEDRG